MDLNNNIDVALSEHRFWLQIMGDHSRIIFYSLAPIESEYILTAQNFIILFNQLFEQTDMLSSLPELEELNRKAYEAVYRLREFKIELLTMSLTSDLNSHLPPTQINDMLNELEEYLYILNSLMQGYQTLLHPLHYHMLWLKDAIGHAASVKSGLDLVEKDLIGQTEQFEQQFNHLYFLSLTLNGYLRTGHNKFTALDRLNEQVWSYMNDFMEFLEKLRDSRADNKVLGILIPLVLDHMLREECYYMQKLSQSTDHIRLPDCNPASPRLEK